MIRRWSPSSARDSEGNPACLPGQASARPIDVSPKTRQPAAPNSLLLLTSSSSYLPPARNPGCQASRHVQDNNPRRPRPAEAPLTRSDRPVALLPTETVHISVPLPRTARDSSRGGLQNSPPPDFRGNTALVAGGEPVEIQVRATDGPKTSSFRFLRMLP